MIKLKELIVKITREIMVEILERYDGIVDVYPFKEKILEKDNSSKLFEFLMEQQFDKILENRILTFLNGTNLDHKKEDICNTSININKSTCRNIDTKINNLKKFKERLKWT